MRPAPRITREYGKVFGRADFAYVIACRAVAPLIEALVPPRLDHSRIGGAPAVQRLTQIFPTWQSELENPNFRPKQKDLMEVVMLSLHRAISDLLSDLHKRVLQWLQGTLPSTTGGLGLTTERIPLGDQVFGRADLAYVIACRAVAPLIEALVPPRLDHSRIGGAPAVQRLTQIFPTWQSELENPDFRPKQKDLVEAVMLSFRRAISDLLSDLHKRVLQAFAAPWVDGKNIVECSAR